MKLYDKELSAFIDNNKKISLISIALPKFFELVSIYLLGTINTLLLSHYSSDSVTAVNVATQVINVFNIIITMILSGGSIVLSFELGRGEYNNGKEIVGNAFAFSLILSVILGITGIIFSKNILTFMNVDYNVLTESNNYFKIRLYGLPITTGMTFITTFLMCYGYTGSSFIVSLISNLLNALFGYIVLYTRISEFIDGTTGVAIGCILAQIAAVIVGIILFKKNKCSFKINFYLKKYTEYFE